MSQMKKNPVEQVKRPVYLLTQKLPFNVQEAYRSLRTNVMFALPGTGCKCIGVTSPTPGDGKSTTAANLAISLAQIDKRVLLVDCDLRLPTVASKFRVKSVPGLSDFLVGQARIEEAIRTVESCNLQILPSGNIPPDATGLLEAKQLETLFNALRDVYDYVIVDLPPVITVPDALILSKYLDGFLLTVRERLTIHRAVKEMLRQLQLTGANAIGFVMTGSDADSGKYYKYRYGKKYGYGYRYKYYRYGYGGHYRKK